MKVSELSGAMLDYWVARTEGLDVILWGGVTQALRRVGNDVEDYCNYSPSSDWGHGGPIIAQEGINLNRAEDGWVASLKRAQGHGHHVGDAEDPLVAAMRCYVASRFGDEVGE